MLDENAPSAITDVKRIPFGPQAERQILALATWMQIYGVINLGCAALQLFGDEGFHQCGRVDIFDGGPVVRCALAEIRSVRSSDELLQKVFLPIRHQRHSPG